MSLILKSKTLVLNVTDKVMYFVYIYIFIFITNEYTGDIWSASFFFQMQRSLVIVLKQRNATVSHFENKRLSIILQVHATSKKNKTKQNN